LTPSARFLEWTMMALPVLFIAADIGGDNVFCMLMTSK
jgi:hypothetical protein